MPISIRSWKLFALLAVPAGLLGCGEDSDSVRGPSPARATTRDPSGRLVVSQGRGQLEGVDGQDDPAGPSALPRSDDVPGWIKTQPVRIALADELARLIDDTDRVARWKPYRIKQVATCRYTRGGETADVVVVLAHASEDAYGLFTVEATPEEQSMTGGAIRVEDPQGKILHAWKGRAYVRMTRGGAAGDSGAGGELLSRILFALPDAERPPELELFPAWEEVTPRRWVARSTVSLIGRVPVDLGKIDELLGLSPDTLLVVVAYPVPSSSVANTLWLVRYETPAAARKAYQSYRKHIDHATDAAAGNTMITEPKGRFLLGTWTAEQESIAHALPRIGALLPG